MNLHLPHAQEVGKMRETVVEESVLFISVLKWFALASLSGVLVGGATALFLNLLGDTTALLGESARAMGFHPYLMLPLGLFVSALLVKYWAPEAEGHGTERVIEAVHKRSGRINPWVVPIKLLASVVTIACGGAAGKEGPCAQIGAGLSSIFASIMRFDDTDRQKIVICGISAGFSSVFGTPIAGALFGVEVLAIGRVHYAVLFPSFVAGMIGFQTAHAFGIQHPHHVIEVSQGFSELFLFQVVLVGVIFGLASFAFIQFMKYIGEWRKKFHWWGPLCAFFGGLLLLLTMQISDSYLGLGAGLIEETLTGEYQATWYDPLMKMLTTSITLSFGGSGGVLTPILFVGATLGSFIGTLFQFAPEVFAAIGMVALLAGCTNTPIAASVMAIELFGPELSPYAAIACIVSFLVVGHRSVYPTQILAMAKSASLNMTIGKTLDDVDCVAYNQIHPPSLGTVKTKEYVEAGQRLIHRWSRSSERIRKP